MILGQVEETVTTAEIDDETYEEIVKVRLCHCHYRVDLLVHTVQFSNACAALGAIVHCPTDNCMPLQTNKRQIPFLFVRGDGVILVSPPLRK